MTANNSNDNSRLTAFREDARRKLELARRRHRGDSPPPQASAPQPPALQPPAPQPPPPAPQPPAVRVELHPDLQRHRHRTPFGDELIRHPLLRAPDREDHYARYNEAYLHKQGQFHMATAPGSGLWDYAMELLEPPYSWQFLWEHRERFDPASYWAHLAGLWVSVECFYEVEELFHELFSYRHAFRAHFMLDEEREFLDTLPPRFRVYRGHVWDEPMGWSWSLLPTVASFFAHRYDRRIERAQESRWPFEDEDEYDEEAPRPGVVTGFVAKEDVLGLLLRRDEWEVVVSPSKVRAVERYPSLKGPDPGTNHHALAQAALQVAEGASRLGRDSVHGEAHWLRVDRNAIELCRRVPGADLAVCRAFAYLHDSQKQDEESDRGHGRRAARFIEKRCGELLAGLNKSQQKRLLYACKCTRRSASAPTPPSASAGTATVLI